MPDTRKMIGEPPAANDVPAPKYAEGDKADPAKKTGYALKTEKGTALHEEESEEQAFHRIGKLIWNVGYPAKQPHMAKIGEIRDAYEGVVTDAENNGKMKKVFPWVYILTDAKLSVVLEKRPKAAFDHEYEKQKMSLIEDAYNHFTSDVDHGLDLDTVDYQWHWYNELYGWAVKRIWTETDTCVRYNPEPERDDKGNIAYDGNGIPKIKYARKLYQHTRVKQRVCEPEQVIVDPRAKTLAEARWIAFITDIHFDEWEQQYKFNDLYQNTDYVHAGQLESYAPVGLIEGTDANNQPALVYGSACPLKNDNVRIVEFYYLDRDEMHVSFNNVPALHIPNPTPPDPDTGEKKLPAADLHSHPRPGSFYSRGEGELSEAMIAIYQRLMNARARRAELASSPVVMSTSTSGFGPKSFKVYPGAFWKGAKGQVETLNLAGVDTGEVMEYLVELKNLFKLTGGIDFERFIAEPDPTAIQQAARDAAGQIRPKKDLARYEAAHVRSMDITLQNIQFWLTIPEIADLADASEEEMAQIQESDKLPPDQATGKQFYRKYNRFRTKGRRFTESYANGRYDLTPAKNVGKEVDGWLNARPEYLRTKGKVKARAISDRKQSANRQIQFENAKTLYDVAMSAPPKNEYEMQQAIMTKNAPPKPEYYVNRQEAVNNLIDATGGDVKKMTAPEGQDAAKAPGPAADLIGKIAQAPHQLMPDPQQLQAMSFAAQNPQPTDAQPAQ